MERKLSRLIQFFELVKHDTRPVSQQTFSEDTALGLLTRDRRTIDEHNIAFVSQ
jgi:hypothetical protein